MNYEEFCIWVTDALKERQSEDVRLELKSVRKNNSVMQERLLFIREGSNIAPAICLKDFYRLYENGMEPEMVLERLQTAYEMNKAETRLDFSFFEDFEKVRERIAYKVINKENNEALLEEVPWTPLLDLAVVFYCILPENVFPNGTILITHEHCDAWKVDEKQLFPIAAENTPSLCPPILLDMKNMLEICESMKEGEEKAGSLETFWKPVSLDALTLSDGANMFVLTNTLRCQGAIAIFYKDFLKKLSEKLDTDFFILPSSIHECILLPAKEGDSIEDLEHLVYSVNHSHVEKEERLSNHVYRYIRERDEII